MWSLIFSFLFLTCLESKKESPAVTIEWEGTQARGIIIPLKLLPGISYDSIEQFVHIQLKNSRTPIVGEYRIIENALTFRPLIAFTHGLKYEVWLSNKLLSEIEIPRNETHDAPMVISIYPTADVLPQNLLKIYIAFSKPMQEGQALQNIAVIKNRKDTIPSIFLDLDQELWNKERTMLTVWLDPGRIKRDLQPNLKMGSPLQQGAPYQILIKNDWRDAEGVSLASTYQKEFLVESRDSLSPDPGRWTIHAPESGSSQTLRIDLHETLDYVLLKNTVSISDSKGNIVNGIIKPEAEETILSFTPSVSWSAGEYTIEIESRLEDLAGNNLNRLFDKDLTKQSPDKQKEIYKRSFQVQ